MQYESEILGESIVMVEIVMATYNGEKYLKEQLDSIFYGSYQNFVLHIHDDGSTDRTKEILEEYQKQYPNRMKLHFHEKNQGIIKNFLMGIKQTTADYVMLCDQDDVWLPKKIERTLAYMKYCEKKKGEDLPITVFTDAQVVDEHLNVIDDSFHQVGRLNVKKRSLDGLLMENKLIGCTMMMNRNVIDRLYRLPEHARMHDWWIGLVTAAFGYIGYLKEPTLLYRQHGSNDVGSKKYFEYVKSRVLHLWNSRKVLYCTIEQGKEFLEVYRGELSKEQREQLEQFVSLPEMNFFERRRIVLENRFLKSTLLRNIGLLLLI